MLVVIDSLVKDLVRQIEFMKEDIDDLIELGYIESIGNDLKQKLDDMDKMISEYYRNQMK
jgi:predicted translin family RNA/ssDNA-binding protein